MRRPAPEMVLEQVLEQGPAQGPAQGPESVLGQEPAWGMVQARGMVPEKEQSARQVQVQVAQANHYYRPHGRLRRRLTRTWRMEGLIPKQIAVACSWLINAVRARALREVGTSGCSGIAALVEPATASEFGGLWPSLARSGDRIAVRLVSSGIDEPVRNFVCDV